MNNKQNENRQANSEAVGQKVQHIYEQHIEVDDSFDISEFQVVRSEFFSHLHEPTITFNRYRFYVNKACLKRLPDVSHIQVLVNPKNHSLLLRPSNESERGAFIWYTDGKKGKQPKQLTCRIFYALMMKMMGWNPDHRYKLLGKLIASRDEYLFVFALNSPAIYQRVGCDPETGIPIGKGTNKPRYPKEWEGSFGLSLEANQKSLQINIFDGYAVYGIADKQQEQMPMVEPTSPVERSEIP